jgi:adenosylcobinamide amidohydrolase
MSGAADPVASSVRVEQEGRWLVVRFDAPHATLGWAPVGGGAGRARAVAWHQVFDRELDRDTDAAALLRERLAGRGLADSVGLLTSASLGGYMDVGVEHDGVAARCVATVGLSNALRVGDPPGPGPAVGTINLLVWLSVGLSEAARLEALSLVAEARTLAVLEAGVPSRRSGGPATGTGTDCIVVASPEASAGVAPAEYAGKHTVAGHLVGMAVEEAVRRGVAGWVAAHGGG